MKVAIFGATGRVGKQVVAQALARGDTVRAYARSGAELPDGVELVVGELHDEEAMRRCIRGCDAVISALGPRKNSKDQVALFGDALDRITRIMREENVKRLVSISGAGTLLPGDPPSFQRTMVRGLMKLVAKHVLESKAREADVILPSGLDWVIVRPPRIVDGAATGSARATYDKPEKTAITTGDCAEFMLRAARDDEHVRTAPFVS